MRTATRAATWALGQMLDDARGFGMNQVLIFYEADNVGSAKTIEHHGGVLEDAGQTAARRYWIEIDKPSYLQEMSLSWEEPPAPPCAEITMEDQLRERPGTWAKVLTSDKVSVSRLGGDLHRAGFEIRATDDQGDYSLYAQWNPDGRTTTVLRPGAGDPAVTDTLRDEALNHLLAATVASAQRCESGDVATLLSGVRQQIKALFTDPDEARRYLQAAGTPSA